MRSLQLASRESCQLRNQVSFRDQRSLRSYRKNSLLSPFIEKRREVLSQNSKLSILDKGAQQHPFVNVYWANKQWVVVVTKSLLGMISKMICNVRWDFLMKMIWWELVLSSNWLVVLNTRRRIAPIFFARFHCRYSAGSFLQNGHSTIA